MLSAQELLWLTYSLAVCVLCMCACVRARARVCVVCTCVHVHTCICVSFVQVEVALRNYTAMAACPVRIQTMVAARGWYERWEHHGEPVVTAADYISTSHQYFRYTPLQNSTLKRSQRTRSRVGGRGVTLGIPEIIYPSSNWGGYSRC